MKITDYGQYHTPGHPIEQFKRIIFRGKKTTYLVSTYGRVISLNYGGWGKVKENKLQIKRDGYKRACLSIEGKSYYPMVHRLVATAFIDNPENKKEVNHINGIKTDNRIWNLEWVTHSENVQHAFREHLHPIKRGEDVPTSKNKEVTIIKVCEMISSGKFSAHEIHKQTGVSEAMIRAIRRRITWKHVCNNYIFPVHLPDD